ncbi:ArdC family protein [Gluconacetobacter sacchari]|uniref:DUF1738 domain-containing protein n=2 Tax=Gluconacetobacter sacchari TaxID=92759 RepID=A0A7W4IH49_9PROT|nr:zincin-like metallopeptidase domain-containing protein [Gluconacetobacter sacchari]MBB2162766.1 DUF1738 domain-containing protein [Gluconacetobacter sacchari]GBQ25783.1 antirestriction protein ArdC [Gluconacetobacter sacchari DSM 12717]
MATRAKASAVRSSGERADIYQEVTDRIVAELENGRLPWVQPWSNTVAAPSVPRNATTGRRYSGINVLLLWGSLQQCGFAFVPEGQKLEAEPRAVPFLKRFTVFNIDQCDGLPIEMTAAPSPQADGDIVPRAERLICATGADLRIGGDKAFYMPALDYIQVPPRFAYFDQVNWYRTVMHETGHWCGHVKRLNRDQTGSFGTHAYMGEEIVAELTAAFVLAELSIQPSVRHADYIGAWIDMLRDDKRAIFKAARLATQAADYILAFEDATVEQTGPDQLAA